MPPTAPDPLARKRQRAGFLLLLALLAMVAAAKAVLCDALDPDFFWHLRVAGQLRSDGIGPIVDRLSFASVQTPWTPYSWLAELGMAWIWDHLGWRGAVAAQAAIQAAFVLLAGWACAARASSLADAKGGRPVVAPDARATSPALLRAAAAAAFALLLSLPYLSFRPVTAALLLLALAMALLVRDRAAGERTRAVWLLVPLTALAINLHLYAVLIPLWLTALLAGAVWERQTADCPADRPEIERRAWRYAWLLTGCAAACLATPMLPGMVRVALHYQFDDAMVGSGAIAEMQPFYRGSAGRAALAAVALFLGCVLWNRRRLRAGETILLLMGGALLLRMGRFAPVFAVMAAPPLAAALPRLSDRLLGRPAVCALLVLVLVLAGGRVVASFPSPGQPLDGWLNRHGPEAAGYPCAAADYVAARVRCASGHVINEFTWGGYLEWRLGGRYQAFLDGRTQLFSRSFWQATYLGTEEERENFLSAVRADAAVLPAARSKFHDPLARIGWTTAYRDERAEVMLPPAAAGAGGKNASWPAASLFFGE